MIDIRPFRNTDAPGLAEVWRAQPPQRGLMQPMSVAVLEHHVLAKPYFDREGLIVAADGGRIVGFAHAGFGPSADCTTLSTEAGVTCLVMVRQDAEASLAAELLARSEAYLRSRGSSIIYGGGWLPLAPFYYGLYGGSEPAGVPNSDPQAAGLFAEHGYSPARRSIVMHRDLGQFRPAVDRQQMQIRRHTKLETIVDPPTISWWDAALVEPLERVQCLLVPRDGGQPLASVYLWNMETMVGTWGVRAAGIVDLVVLGAQKRQGLATFLVGESLRQIHTQGVTLAEVQVDAENEPALAMFRKLGFDEVDQAVVYRKD